MKSHRRFPAGQDDIRKRRGVYRIEQVRRLRTVEIDHPAVAGGAEALKVSHIVVLQLAVFHPFAEQLGQRSVLIRPQRGQFDVFVVVPHRDTDAVQIGTQSRHIDPRNRKAQGRRLVVTGLFVTGLTGAARTTGNQCVACRVNEGLHADQLKALDGIDTNRINMVAGFVDRNKISPVHDFGSRFFRHLFQHINQHHRAEPAAAA